MGIRNGVLADARSFFKEPELPRRFYGAQPFRRPRFAGYVRTRSGSPGDAGRGSFKRRGGLHQGVSRGRISQTI